MKDSSKWVRQEEVDEAADAIVAERRCSFAEVKPYWVAKKLEADPSGEIYEKVRSWRRRRDAESAATMIEVPPQAEAAFRATIDQFVADAMACFLDTVRSVGSDLDRTAALRIGDAERRRDQAETECVDVVALCRKAETDRDAAYARICELEQALADGQRREDRLNGRLEHYAAEASTITNPLPDATSPAASDDG